MERAFSQKPFSQCSGLKAKAAQVSSHVPINSSTTSLRTSYENQTLPPRELSYFWSKCDLVAEGLKLAKSMLGQSFGVLFLKVISS